MKVDEHDFCPFCGKCRVCGRTIIDIRKLLQLGAKDLAECKSIEAEEEIQSSKPKAIKEET